MYKFIKGAEKPTLNMVKIDMDGKEVWLDCTPAVKVFAKSNFKAGDEVVFEHSESKDEKGKTKLTITGHIKKEGASTDGPSPSEAGGYGGGKETYSGDKQTSIRSQAIGKMTASVLIALQGHVDPTNFESLIDKIYDKFDAKIK